MSLELFRVARESTAEILDRLTPAEWLREGTHTEVGRYGVEALAEDLRGPRAQARAADSGRARRQRMAGSVKRGVSLAACSEFCYEYSRNRSRVRRNASSSAFQRRDSASTRSPLPSRSPARSRSDP